MSNFTFLKDKKEYELFAPACIEAEKIYASAPAMCAVGCRKALELAVKWVYAADNTMRMPYRDNLQSLIHEPSFRYAVDAGTWEQMFFLVKCGNRAVHSNQKFDKSYVLASLKALFGFIEWIDYCYGEDYIERKFDESLIPKEKVAVDTKKIKEQESLLDEKESEIKRLREEIAKMSAHYTSEKHQHMDERSFTTAEISEYETRKIYIDYAMEEVGWTLKGNGADVAIEYPVDNMAGVSGQKGYCDYVLFGKDGLPLAVVEAKRSSKDPNIGRKQAVLYADALERKFGRRPMMFTTNGFTTYFWDDKTSPQRRVSGIFSKEDLQKLMNRRDEKLALDTITINDKITDRYYQKEAIRAVCEQISSGERKNLLVMATGTGKTRTASSLTDVLSRGKWITNVLFLADRTALVKQAKDDFKNYLPDMSLCNLCSNKDDRQARIVFSTYPTILNAIDETTVKTGQPLFTPAHFDLIIIDESHRSIFKKYKAIFEYFDAVLVGLTATPKTEGDRNVYDFFEMENGVPTYAYDYNTAVEQDHVLVPYYNYEVKTKFLEDGIKYDELSEEDKDRFEDDFDDETNFIPPTQLYKFVFNETTVDMVLQDLMERGIHVAGGDRLGKTIVFAQNKSHAEFILERFNKLYPQYNGTFAQRVICDDAYAQTIIDDFKQQEKEPHIAVSVDMMDTGIDVPHVVNLVFFKRVRSKAKFWQMIGRGTRLCPELNCVDQIDGEYTGKRRFLIFDYCSNFEFFREHIKGYEGTETKTLSENIFSKQIEIIFMLQQRAFLEEKYQKLRIQLVDICYQQITKLNTQLLNVKLQLQYVEKYKHKEVFAALDETAKDELVNKLAPLVVFEEKDEFAKRFDSFMYGLILAQLKAKTNKFKHDKNVLCKTAFDLEQKISIPQIKEKIHIIREVQEDEFWQRSDSVVLENVREELRELIKFLDSGKYRKTIITRLSDLVTSSQEGITIDIGDDFENYRAKVNRYINEHGNTLAIHKLTHNIPLEVGDYQELERIFTSELGSKEDYEHEFGQTPFGLLVRKIAKLDHEAAMQAFSKFINDEALNAKQIAFVNKIIKHIEVNGYMDDEDLLKPQFSNAFFKLFDDKYGSAIIDIINQVKENACIVKAS